MRITLLLLLSIFSIPAMAQDLAGLHTAQDFTAENLLRKILRDLHSMLQEIYTSSILNKTEPLGWLILTALLRFLSHYPKAVLQTPFSLIARERCIWRISKDTIF